MKLNFFSCLIFIIFLISNARADCGKKSLVNFVIDISTSIGEKTFNETRTKIEDMVTLINNKNDVVVSFFLIKNQRQSARVECALDKDNIPGNVQKELKKIKYPNAPNFLTTDLSSSFEYYLYEDDDCGISAIFEHTYMNIFILFSDGFFDDRAEQTIQEAKIRRNIILVSVGITQEVNKPFLQNVSSAYFDFDGILSRDGLDVFSEVINKITLRECQKNIFKY